MGKTYPKGGIRIRNYQEHKHYPKRQFLFWNVFFSLVGNVYESIWNLYFHPKSYFVFSLIFLYEGILIINHLESYRTPKFTSYLWIIFKKMENVFRIIWSPTPTPSIYKKYMCYLVGYFCTIKHTFYMFTFCSLNHINKQFYNFVIFAINNFV